MSHRQKHSSFDRIKSHLLLRGADEALPPELNEDLEILSRRCDTVRSLGREYGSVELSPYMTSLLRMPALPAETAGYVAPIAASV